MLEKHVSKRSEGYLGILKKRERRSPTLNETSFITLNNTNADFPDGIMLGSPEGFCEGVSVGSGLLEGDSDGANSGVGATLIVGSSDG